MVISTKDNNIVTDTDLKVSTVSMDLYIKAYYILKLLDDQRDLIDSYVELFTIGEDQ
jgi:hypothetical protein